MRALSRRSASRVAVAGLIAALGFGTLLWIAAASQDHPGESAEMTPPWEQPPLAVTDADIVAA